MLERMQTGRWKVFEHLEDWFAEFRLYHRKDGQVVKLRDDIMSATRYGVMMIRESVVEPARLRRAPGGRPHRREAGICVACSSAARWPARRGSSPRGSWVPARATRSTMPS